MKKHYLIKIVALVIFSLAGQISRAQLVDCNVFLPGNYVEVGINWNGAYGSSTAAPAGYHPKGSSPVFNSIACGHTSCALGTGLGFVADPDRDGWAVGSPAYFGDYFLPGFPQEGWSFMDNGKQVNAWNGNAYDTALDYSVQTIVTYTTDSAIVYHTPYWDSITSTWDTLTTYAVDSTVALDTTYYIHGGNIIFDSSGPLLTGIWQGMFDSVAITQITTLNPDSLYFNIEVIMTNLSATPKENVYYLRTVDPDNAEPESSDFRTYNKINYQLPNPSGLSVVSAWDSTYPNAYLALSSADPRAKVFVNKTDLWPGVGNLATMYAVDTNYLYDTGSVYFSDVAINMVFQIGHLAGVDTIGASYSAYRTTSYSTPAPNRAIIDYTYNFDGAHPGAGVLKSGQITHTGSIQVYPNPAGNVLNVTGAEPGGRISLYDVMGNSIRSVTAAGGRQSVDLSDMAPGNYLVVVSDAKESVQSRNVIQKL